MEKKLFFEQILAPLAQIWTLICVCVRACACVCVCVCVWILPLLDVRYSCKLSFYAI